MKRFMILVFLVLFVLLFIPSGQSQSETKRALVKFRGPQIDVGLRHIAELPRIGVHLFELPARWEEALAGFQNRPDIEFAELDAWVPPALIPNDPLYPSQWHLPQINAPAAWDTTTGNPSVIIAILDTGVDPTHPDLAGKMVPGWNFYDNNSDTSDVFGHGTAVAGTATAISDNGVLVASVAWGCALMPIRISAPNGNGSTSAMANGLTWAADHGARVANISYKVSTSPTITTAARYFETFGGVVTIAAGNDGTFVSTPDNPDVLTVSATVRDDLLAPFTTTGNNVDLSAPGRDIWTTGNGGGSALWTGTSFSAPIVAGVAALVISANPALMASQIQEVIKQSADDLGSSGWDTSFGWGRVNAARAVALAPNPPPPVGDTSPPTITITSPTDGAIVTGTSVSVLVNTVDNVGVAKLELYVDGELKATATAAPFTTKWNTRRVTGTHVLQTKAYDAANNIGMSPAISVTVQ